MTKQQNLLKSLAVSLPLLLAPTLVMAHPAADHAGSLTNGLVHPFLGADHLLAMVALGMIAIRAGGSAIFLIPATFVVSMSVAAMLAAGGMVLPAVETGITLSLVVLGALVALYRQLPLPGAIGLAALFGLFHGYAHGAEIPGSASALVYGAGFIVATIGLHALGIFVGLAFSRRSILLRCAGVMTSMLGLVMAFQMS